MRRSVRELLLPFAAAAALAPGSGCHPPPVVTDAAGLDVSSLDSAESAVPVDAPDAADSPEAGVAPRGYRACADPVHDPLSGFCDATTLWGVDGRYPAEMSGFVTGAIAAADFDGDGRVDLFITVNTTLAPRLLLNRGGHFENVSDAWHVTGFQHTIACVAFDVEGDGDEDLALVESRTDVVHLLRNDGNGFTEVTPALGGTMRTDATAVIAHDFDRDGSLDLAVAFRFAMRGCTGPFASGCPGGMAVYRQTAPWRFEPVTVDAPPHGSLAIRALDWDDDGFDELLVATDFGMLDGGNQILRVVPDPGGVGFSLRDGTAGTGFDQEIFGMGIAAIDADGDGRDEVIVTNFGRNLLLRRSAGVGTDVAVALGADAYGMWLGGPPPHYRYFDPDSPFEGGFARFTAGYLDPASPQYPSTKWTPVVLDFDDDGIEDVYFPSGFVGFDSVLPEVVGQYGGALRGTGSGFQDVTDALSLGERRDARAAVKADFDGDGDLDLAVFETAQPGEPPAGVRMLRNDASRGRAVTVIARGRGAARDGIGASVDVRVGSRHFFRHVDGSESNFGSSPNETHVGLGDSTVVDEITVRFPSGNVSRAMSVPFGRVVVTE